MSRKIPQLPEETADGTLIAWVNLPEAGLVEESEIQHFIRHHPEIFEDPVWRLELSDDQKTLVYAIRQHLRAAWDAPDRRTGEWYIFVLRDLYARAARQRYYAEAAKEAAKTVPAVFARFQMLSAQMRVPGETYAEHAKRVASRLKELGPEEYARLPYSQNEAAEIRDRLADPKPSGFRDTFRDLFESGMLVQPPPPLVPFEYLMSHLQRQLHRAIHCANPACRRPYFFKEEGVRTKTYCSDECWRPMRLESQRRYWKKTNPGRRGD
jgi:hypothetical protein